MFLKNFMKNYYLKNFINVKKNGVKIFIIKMVFFLVILKNYFKYSVLFMTIYTVLITLSYLKIMIIQKYFFENIYLNL
jgi:hypothetical protein